MNYDEQPSLDVARYREFQKALPGVEALYTLGLAFLEHSLPEGGRVLVVGAGGGREIEALASSQSPLEITGVDPSDEMLKVARHYADKSDRSGSVALIKGTTLDLDPEHGGFDAATSFLVMHFLPDDDTPRGKRSYLDAIRARLRAGALLLHADVSFDSREAYALLKPGFIKHGTLAGLDGDAIANGAHVIGSMPIIGETRTAQLFEASGFEAPSLFFQTLWYRAWLSRAI